MMENMMQGMGGAMWVWCGVGIILLLLLVGLAAYLGAKAATREA